MPAKTPIETVTQQPIIDRSRTNRDRALICLLLAALTLVAFWQVLGNGFIGSDDPEYVIDNHHVYTGLRPANVVWAFTHAHSFNWHPVTWLSHMLDCQVYGLHPMGHHLTSLLFHVANTLLLFLLLAGMTGRNWPSAFVAALFAVHPLHVESVAWVAERKDVLSTFLGLLTLLAYVSYARNPGVRRYIVVAVLFAVGLMAKPMLVTLPLVMLMLDYWPLGRFEQVQEKKARNAKRAPWVGWKLVREKVPLIGLSAISCVVTYYVQNMTGAVTPLRYMPLTVRVPNALVSYFRYLGKMIWPSELAIYYPHPMSSLPIWQAAAALVALVAVTWLAVRMAKRSPYVAVGWLWYVVTLIPVIGFVQVGMQSMADRYTYIPLIGIFVMIAWGLPQVFEGLGKRLHWLALAVPAVAVILVLIPITRAQSAYWKNDKMLFGHAMSATRDNELVEYSVGMVLSREGKRDEAERHFLRALEIAPDYKEAHIGMGNLLSAQGKHQEAIERYREALRIRPDFAVAHNNLGLALGRVGMTREALDEFDEAVRLKPDYLDAHYNLARALARQGRLDEAVEQYEKVLEINPKNADARCNLGNTLAAQGKTSGAIDEFTKSLEIKPNNAMAHNNLGNALASSGRLDEALEHFTEAIRLKPDYANAHFNVALVYFCQNDCAGAWREVHEGERYGGHAAPAFRKALSEKMPEPRQ